MKAIIECVKGTFEKYEITPKGTFEISRMLKHRWVANYGFVPETLQADGDELDVYVIGRVAQGEEVEVFPLCLLKVIDNGEIDNKLICIAETSTSFLVKHKIRRIRRFVSKYKKGCLLLAETWSSEAVRYEIAKRKAFYKLFKGGKKCQY